MDERPSFRRRKDMWRLVLALAVPWVLLGIAYSAPLLDRALSRAGHDTSWMGDAPLIWFYGFGFPALFSLIGVFFLGIYWLVRRREYRCSRYGWLWLVLAWLNMCALTALAESKSVVMM